MKYCFTLIALISFSGFKSSATIEQPSKLKAEVISATQVKLSWNGGINDLSYLVRIKEKKETVWTEFFVTAPSTNRRISNLKPGSTYQWEIQSCGKSKRDVSEKTTGELFTTYSSCNAPESISMVRSGLDYLIIDWEDNGSAKYEVKVRALNSDEWISYFTQSNSIRIDNLLPYTEYEIAASSFCKESDLSGSVFSAAETFSTHSFLQNDFERIVYTENSSSENANSKMISGARLINKLGQSISDIKPACFSSKGIYFDFNSNIPSGIYVVQIPGTEGMRCLLW